MYTVKIRSHVMIAHSFNDSFFGPATRLHGATYVVDASFYAENIDAHNVVIDIGKAQEVLDSVLEPLRYRNLDELPIFKNKLTTTEFLAKYIHSGIKEKSAAIFTGKIKVTLGESHIAWASYEE